MLLNLSADKSKKVVNAIIDNLGSVPKPNIFCLPGPNQAVSANLILKT